MRHLAFMVLALAFGSLFATAQASTVLSQGPESVFDQPLSNIFPDLAGATRSRESGNLNGQLAYWGYKLASGQTVMFYACSERAGSKCSDVAPRICRGSAANILKTGEARGLVTYQSCQKACHVVAEDLRTCCTTKEKKEPLATGLVSCGG